jgi:hypothetical protein
MVTSVLKLLGGRNKLNMIIKPTTGLAYKDTSCKKESPLSAVSLSKVSVTKL